MKIKNGSTEIEIEPQDVFNALTESCCPGSRWGNCECGKCVNGVILNEEGRMLRQLFFKI